MRFLLMSSSFPYPVDGGHETTLVGFLDYAVREFGAENVLLLCVSPASNEEDSASLAPCSVVFFKPASAIRRAVLLAFDSLLLGRTAFQEALVAAPHARSRIAAIFDEFDPEVVLVDTIRMVQHLPSKHRTGRRHVLYLDDLYSLRYRRMLSAIDEHPGTAVDPIGTFGRFLPGIFRRLVSSRAVQRRLLRFESAILARREAAMPKQFDQVILANASEAERLARTTGATNVSAVMTVLRLTRPLAPPARAFAGDPMFLFLGNLQQPANAHGLELFLRVVMPLFLSRVPAGQLMIVGAGASRGLRELGEKLGPAASFLGYVQDLDAISSAAAAMVVPVFFGTGIRIKVVEALARGLPVISTRLGIDGLDLVPGRHCLVEDDLTRFADGMVRLLDPAVNGEFARQGFAVYQERLAPEVVARSYRNAIFGDGFPDAA